MSYCHIDRVTGQQDTDPNYCPLATFTTDKLGQWSGEIQVSDLKWTNKVENFYVTAFYNQTLSNNRYIVHTFEPTAQETVRQHGMAHVQEIKNEGKKDEKPEPATAQ